MTSWALRGEVTSERGETEATMPMEEKKSPRAEKPAMVPQRLCEDEGGEGTVSLRRRRREGEIRKKARTHPQSPLHPPLLLRRPNRRHPTLLSEGPVPAAAEFLAGLGEHTTEGGEVQDGEDDLSLYRPGREEKRSVSAV